MENVIRRVNLELNGDGGVDGLALQQSVSEWTQEALVPTLEDILEPWSDSEETVWIDRLDLELTSVSYQNWQQALLDEVKGELPSALLRQVQVSLGLARAPVQDEGEASEGRDRVAVVSEAGMLDALLYYLGHGHLPWYVVGPAQGSFEARTAQWLSVATTAGLAARLLPALRTEDARRRFVRTLSGASLRRFSERWVEIPSARWIEWERDIAALVELFTRVSISAAGAGSPAAKVIASRVSDHVLPEVFWVGLLAEIAAVASPGGARGALATEDLSFRAVARCIETCVNAAARPADAFDEIRRLTEPRSPFVTAQFRQAMLARKTSIQTTSVSGQALESPRELDDAGPESMSGRDKGSSRKRAPPPALPSAEPHGQFVTHAGLVLLGPYLQMFLERIGLAQGGRLTDPGAALVAVQYLGTGQEVAPPEYELVLPKLLCGFGLDEAPPALPTVSADIVRESNELLSSVVEHWSALKNTSADSLREAFLQRDGKLSLRQDGTWLLQVEQKAYDMLLEYLPWGYQMTKLPWMERILITEWVD